MLLSVALTFFLLISFLFIFFSFSLLTTALHYPLYSCCCPLFVLDSVCTVTVSFQSIIGHFWATCVSQNRTARTAHALVSELLVIPCNLISITATLSAHNSILPYCSLPLPLVELRISTFQIDFRSFESSDGNECGLQIFKFKLLYDVLRAAQHVRDLGIYRVKGPKSNGLI